MLEKNPNGADTQGSRENNGKSPGFSHSDICLPSHPSLDLSLGEDLAIPLKNFCVGPSDLMEAFHLLCLPGDSLIKR